MPFFDGLRRRRRTGNLSRMTDPPDSAPERISRTRRVAAWMLAALTLAAVATLAVVAWYPYPDLQAGYATTGGLLMAGLSVGGFVLMRRERKREVSRRSVYQAVIWTSAFFLVFVAPTCIGTLTASRP